MTHYLTDHNLGYDHKSACMQKHVHLRGISSMDAWWMVSAEAIEAKNPKAKKLIITADIFGE